MRAVSPLQVLPLHIVELILDYVAGNSRLIFDDTSQGSSEHGELLLPLMNACSNFGAPGLERICRVYELRLSDIPGEYRDKHPSWSRCLRNAGAPTHVRARELDITLSVLDVCSGAALGVLSSELAIDCTFPKARLLRFMFYLPDEDIWTDAATTLLDADSNISAFVRRIKCMAPVANKVCISVAGRHRHDKPHVRQFDMLVAQLSQLVPDVGYHFWYQLVTIDLQLSGLTRLAYSSLAFSDNGEVVIQLAQRNALTLQHFSIELQLDTIISSFIQNADGSYVQYPCLYTLRIHGPKLPIATLRRVFPGAVPFPHLLRLSIGYMYPFGDDTPFRGNAATLKSLKLDPSPGMLSILYEHKVFTPISHPKLQYVSLGVISDFEPSPFDTDVEYMRFALSIGPNAPVRTVRDTLVGPRIQSVIPVLREHSCIQVLTFFGLELNIWDVIALVKALPLLTDLYTAASVLGPLPNGMPKHKLPAYVIENCALASKRFRCWNFFCNAESEIKGSVRCVLLLALACPDFDYAAVNLASRELFMAYMKKMIVTDGFRPYKTRLRRLLFGGCDNEILNVNILHARSAAFLASFRAARALQSA
ncbi:hypothetical protein GGF38_001291 [Coemansia sp. RSA 25]|nr:hypothetical protein GGF38_001291 [Coemansia sp. RSA 25]